MDMNGTLFTRRSEFFASHAVSMLDTKSGKVTNIKVPTSWVGCPDFTAYDGSEAYAGHGDRVTCRGAGACFRVDPNTMKYGRFPRPPGFEWRRASIAMMTRKETFWQPLVSGALRFIRALMTITEYSSPPPTILAPAVRRNRRGTPRATVCDAINIDPRDMADVETGKTL